MKKSVIVIIACLAIAGTAFAQFDSLNVSFVGNWEASSDLQSVFVKDSYAYVTQFESGLHIIDVSTPSDPQHIGYYNTSSFTWDVHVSDQYAYVACSDGLYIIDVSTPSEPQEVGYCEGLSVAVSISGEYAYIAADALGLRIIDVSDPSDLKQVGGYDTPGSAWDVYVMDSYAYIADQSAGLRVIDISEPTDPQEVGYCIFEETSAEAVHVSGNYAYVSCSYSGIGVYSGLHLVDISEPSNPQQVDSVEVPTFASDVFVCDSYAYVGCGSGLGGGEYDGFRVVDVTDAQDIQEVGYYGDTVSGLPVSGIYASGPYVYVATSAGKLSELDIYQNLLWEGIEEETPPTASPIQLTTSLNRLSYNLTGQAQLSVYSADGRLVLTETVEGKGIWEAPTELPQGVHFARVVTENHTARSKVVVVR